jgi:hypothetical protein
MSKKAIHVVPGDGGWKVRTAGAAKAAKCTTTQAEAISHGKKMAMRTKTELIVHRTDGTIRSKDSFGPDPFPPRDREH